MWIQLLEAELKAKIEELSEQNKELKHQHQAELTSRQLHAACDQQQQPAFTSSPAYKSLMTTVGHSANNSQVSAYAP